MFNCLVLVWRVKCGWPRAATKQSSRPGPSPIGGFLGSVNRENDRAQQEMRDSVEWWVGKLKPGRQQLERLLMSGVYDAVTGIWNRFHEYKNSQSDMAINSDCRAVILGGACSIMYSSRVR